MCELACVPFCHGIVCQVAGGGQIFACAGDLGDPLHVVVELYSRLVFALTLNSCQQRLEEHGAGEVKALRFPLRSCLQHLFHYRRRHPHACSRRKDATSSLT